MVFDNVEDIADIKDIWVDSRHGSVLITARHEFVSLLPVNTMFHVPYMTEDQGAKFLISMSKENGASKANVDSGKELSELLGGLPLALTIMAMQVRRRRMSLPSFLSFYKENEARLHGSDKRISLEPFYPHNLTTAYRLSFQSLKETPAALLRVMSLMSPDDIPLKLFHPEGAVTLPAVLSFCRDTWEYVLYYGIL
jgi:hypothetical protein